jgi:hypothetical protein
LGWFKFSLLRREELLVWVVLDGRLLRCVSKNKSRLNVFF